MAEPEVRMLACGMPLLVERIEGVKSAGFSWLITGGASRDPEGKEGLSALWSDLLLRGAGDLDSRAHRDALDSLGCSTGTLVRTFYMSLGGTLLGERISDALPLVVDMVLRPRFDEESLAPVKDLCSQAIEGLKDEPQERVAIETTRQHMSAPLNRSGIGTLAGIAAVSQTDVVEGWTKGAKPKGSILAFAGDVDGDRLEGELNQLLDGWSGAPSAAAHPGPGLRGYTPIIDETNQTHITIAYDSPQEDDANSMLERVVTSALSGGMSGRLFTEVRERRGLCYSVYASYRADREFGRTIAYSGTTPERAQDTFDVLLAELDKINGKPSEGGGVSESEFERAIIGMKSRTVMSGESTNARASALAGDYHKLGRPRSLDEITRQIDAVTLDAVNGYLEGRRLGDITIVSLGPGELQMPGF